ncbi:MAG: trypsin-like peptidase domain-containing protein [Flavobacteriales bacterium]|nr:trypsin-like peptidase domain-containing protein [Flavobacteriales bacterium]MBK7112867.1 trypsin-like peptidase domain-containing protein [Flavobacteriales bacterium]
MEKYLLNSLRLSVLVCAIGNLVPVCAQISQGGSPASIGRSLSAHQGVRTPDIDLVELAAVDAVNDQDKSIPWRFGKNHAVNLDLANSGSWNTLEDGTRLWRLGIECPGALSVNFEFHDFRPAPGARVFVVDQWGGHIGSFTSANDHGDHVLGVQSVKGSRITVEYEVPATGPIGNLRVGQITHGYRDVFGFARALGSSGSCNNNVICPEGDAWRDQIRSVAMITVNGSGICTGTLINNCNDDGTPYFLTANHCVGSGVSTWVFRFNWESSSCTQNLNGPTNQTISGASLLLNSSPSDVALLQLNSTPPSSYDVFYSGWDKGTDVPTSAVGIHHPSGDIKKISFENDPLTSADYLGNAGSGTSHWRVEDWDDGTTEGGSSGSALYNSAGRIVGQLHGGWASCSSQTADYYGRFNVSYPLLQSWLGSCGDAVNGYDPNAPSVALDARAVGFIGAPANVCTASISPSVTVLNGGTSTLNSFTIAWSVAGGASGSVPWNGVLATGASVNVPLGSISLVSGSNVLSATVNSPNGGADQLPANNTATATVVSGTNTVTLNLILDRYGNESSWMIRSGATTYASGGPYSQQGSTGEYPLDPIVVCLPDGCYEFVMNDSYGDGLCCAYGNGSFSLAGAAGTLATGGTFTSTSVHAFCVQSSILLSAQVMLGGPYGAGPLMSDALRTGGWIPTAEPYTAMGFTHVGGGGEVLGANVLTTTDENAIVDWVFVELRSSASANTVVATRSALLQRDGDIVDTDGLSPVSFGVGSGAYHVAVLHRNHLGVMTNATVALSSAPATVDFKSVATVAYGTEAQLNVGGVQMLWAGDCTYNGALHYTGELNDRDAILNLIGGTVPTNSVTGYLNEDVNMDGVARYTGVSNDRDIILQNIGGVVPTNSRSAQLP